MAWLIASSALVLTGGGLWYLFRRRAPVLTTENLPPITPENVNVVPRLDDEERTAVKTAFLSGNDFR